ncbi:MAG: hypothetical protein HY553_00795 [Elusimicrobia bacterium]|nr:hypothetical protein [Elusimicrobiota bacterium]
MFERDAARRKRLALAYGGLTLGAIGLAALWFYVDFSPAGSPAGRFLRFGDAAGSGGAAVRVPALAKRLALFLAGEDGRPGLFSVTDKKTGFDFHARLAELILPDASNDERELFLLAFMDDRDLRGRWQAFLQSNPSPEEVDAFVAKLKQSGLLDVPAAKLARDKERRERVQRAKERMLVAGEPEGGEAAEPQAPRRLAEGGAGPSRFSGGTPQGGGGGGGFLAVVSKLDPQEQEAVRKELAKGASGKEACERAGLADRCRRAAVHCTLDPKCRPELKGQDEGFRTAQGASGSAGVSAAGLLDRLGASPGAGDHAYATGGVSGGSGDGAARAGTGGGSAAAARGDAHGVGKLAALNATGPDKNTVPWIDSMFRMLTKGQRDLLLSVCLDQDICNPPATCAAAGLYQACVTACNAWPPCTNANVMPATEPTTTSGPTTTTAGGSTTTGPATTTTEATTTSSPPTTTTTTGPTGQCEFPEPPVWSEMLCGNCPNFPGVPTCGCGQKLWVRQSLRDGQSDLSCPVQTDCRADAGCVDGPTTTTAGSVTTTAAATTTTPRPTTTTQDCSSGTCPPGKVWCPTLCRCRSGADASVCPF